MELLLSHVTAVTMEEPGAIIENAYLAVDGGKIISVGTARPAGPFDREIDCTGKIAMPGLINAHTHVPMTVLRGYADDYCLQDWLQNYIFPAEAKMDERCVAAGALLGFAEMIRCGITSVTEMYFKTPVIAKTALETGIKANICNGALSFDPEGYDFEKAGETQEMRLALETWHGADDGRLKLDVGIHGEYTSFEKLWRKNAEFAAEHDLNVHIHVSETKKEHEECIARHGKTPIAMLAQSGAFDTRATAAHCVYVTEDDMEIMRRKSVTAAHNPVSNLKLASGIAPVAKMLQKGVSVALGTDGVASNNSHDLFEEIKLCALLQKGISGDPKSLPAWQALRCATVGGAFAQRREKECGMLKPGMDADLILVDADYFCLQPIYQPVSALCYSVTGRDVCLTMVRGKILYENGKFTTIDLEKALYEVNHYAVAHILEK
ncbi:amidohydrolase family protein [Acidaminobacterium chupaoyuni]